MSADDMAADPALIATRGDFARQLTLARKRARLTVREIAQSAGTPSGTVGGYFSGRHLPSLTHLAPFVEVLRVMGIDDHEPWVDALRTIRFARSVRAADHAAPYKGLESYQAEDEQWFFGRDDVTAAVFETIRERSTTGGVVTVIGASGSGKSSVLRAGVVPRLLAGALGGNWRVVFMVPGAHPVQELDRLFAESAERDRCVLVVDQFEEVFTQCADPGEREAFVHRLTADSPSTVVVLGMRADFYAAATHIPRLIPALEGAQVVVGPMSADNLRSAITEPARRAGVDPDPELVDHLLRDVAPPGWRQRAHDPGALPLLSHALRATWDRAGDNRLTVEKYQSTGGIAGAVAQSAEDVFHGLSAEGRALAQPMFLRLVSDDGEVTSRRRARWDELIDPDQTDAAGADVLERFIAARLLTADEDSVTVSHEALLDAWPRIQKWIDVDRAGLRLHRQLTEAADSWHEADQEPSILWRGARLEAAREWAGGGERPPVLSRREREFLDAGQAARDSDAAADRRRSRRLQRLLGVVALLAVVALVAALLTVRSANRAEQAQEDALSRQVAIQANALSEDDPALAQEFALASYRISPTVEARSALLDLSSKAVVSRIAVPTGPASVSISLDGELIASGNVDGKLRLFANDGTGIRPLGEVEVDPENQMYGVAISPDKRLAAIGGTGTDVHLVDISDPEAPVVTDVAMPADGIEALRFSPDGQILVGSSNTGVAYRWQIGPDGSATDLGSLTGHDGPLHLASFSADGHRVVTASADGVVRVWDAALPGETSTPTHLASVGDPETSILAAAFSPDGRTLAVGGTDAKVHFFAVRSRRLVPQGEPLEGFTANVNHMEFSHDGTELVAGSSDTTVRVWDLATRAQVATINNAGPVTALFYVGDTREVLFGSPSGYVRLWRRPGASLPPTGSRILGGAFTADGARLVVGTGLAEGFGAQIWDVSDRSHPRMLGTTPPDPDIAHAGKLAISPDGALLATGTLTGEVLLWDAGDPADVRRLATLKGSDAAVQGVALNDDGTRLAVAGDDSIVYLWDIADPEQPKLLASAADAADRFLAVAFQPGGDVLAATSADRAAYLYDVSSDQLGLMKTLDEFENFVHAVDFSSDGRTMVVGADDRRVRLFDMSDPTEPRLIGEPLGGPNGYVYSVDLSADGKTLAAVADGVTWLWDTSDVENPELIGTLRAASELLYSVAISPADGSVVAGGAEYRLFSWEPDVERVSAWLCERSGSGMTEDEWEQYFPAAPYTEPCP